MVPTEVLARQHLESINELIAENELNINTVLLTGSMKAKEKREAPGQMISPIEQLNMPIQSCRCRNNHSHNGSFHFHGLRRKFIPDCFISGDFLNSFFKRLRSSCESRLYLSRNALQNISVNC